MTRSGIEVCFINCLSWVSPVASSVGPRTFFPIAAQQSGGTPPAAGLFVGVLVFRRVPSLAPFFSFSILMIFLFTFRLQSPSLFMPTILPSGLLLQTSRLPPLLSKMPFPLSPLGPVTGCSLLMLTSVRLLSSPRTLGRPNPASFSTLMALLLDLIPTPLFSGSRSTARLVSLPTFAHS